MDLHDQLTIERFWLYSLTDGDCRLWQGQCSKKGYGLTTYYGKRRRVHQVAYELLVGPRPPGLVPDHTCRRPNCWNPDHLEWVTDKVNILRGNGFAARNARKTHCANGHEFTPENTIIRKPRPNRATERICRTCRRQYENEREKRRRAEQRARKEAAVTILDTWDLSEDDLRDWQYEVANGDTLRGFVDWVDHRSEQALVDCEAGLS